RLGRADPSFPGGRNLRKGQVRGLPSAQSVAELGRHLPARKITATKKRPAGRFFVCIVGVPYFAAGFAFCMSSSFLRCSSARFCSSSCSFFWFSSNTFGSVGGPS